MLRLLLMPAALFVLTFLLPVAASTVRWAVTDRPTSWRAADWGASGLLETTPDGPAIHILSARTGGWKGAVASHSWLVYRRAGEARWTRWDVVGWGDPVRRDAYAPDGRWYSNEPWIIGSVTGPAATALIPQVEAAIADYPHSGQGAYTIFPGPNSNTFVAHILRETPGIGFTLPPIAVGKDWLGPGAQARRDAGGDLHASLSGLAGVSIGPRTGLELHLLGQTLGLDILRPALKLPGIGRVGLPQV